MLSLQNFIYKHIANIENVQGKKKNEKDEFIGCELLCTHRH